jgi:myosin heavy subunit
MLSKIFVVFNFIVAICIMVGGLTLYAKKIHWVDQTKKSVEERNQQVEKRQKAEKDYRTLELNTTEKITTLTDTNRQLDTKLAEKEEAIKALDIKNQQLLSDLGAIKDNIASVETRLQEQADRNKQLLADNEVAKKERDEAVLAREFAEKQAIEVVAELKEAEAELLQLAKKNHSLVERVMEQDILLDEAQKRGFDPTALASAKSATPIAGHVLEVDEAVGIVILNVGSKNKVKAGMEMIISRGDQYIGKVRIRSIYEDMCSAVILPDMMKGPVQVSDTAQNM